MVRLILRIMCAMTVILVCGCSVVDPSDMSEIERLINELPADKVGMLKHRVSNATVQGELSKYGDKAIFWSRCFDLDHVAGLPETEKFLNDDMNDIIDKYSVNTGVQDWAAKVAFRLDIGVNRIIWYLERYFATDPREVIRAAMRQEEEHWIQTEMSYSGKTRDKYRCVSDIVMGAEAWIDVLGKDADPDQVKVTEMAEFVISARGNVVSQLIGIIGQAAWLVEWLPVLCALNVEVCPEDTIPSPVIPLPDAPNPDPGSP